MANDNYILLLKKLDEFIRKYYKNRLIRGGLLFAGFAAIFFLLTITVEYFFRFPLPVRTTIFYSYLACNFFVLAYYIIIPLLKLYRIGQCLSYEDAAAIIGKHFSEISDRLLNILQLRDLHESNPDSRSLIEASINQKIAAIKPVPFVLAVDFRKNKKYLRYALPPFLLLILLAFTAPSLIEHGTNRLIRYNSSKIDEAPFDFVIMNKSLQVIQQQDFQLDVKLTGDEIPDQVFLEVGETRYKLNKESTILFHYTFKNVLKDIPFRLSADGYTSPDFTLKSLPSPSIVNFQALLNYPAYLNKKDEVVNNTGDLLVPEGTRITWKFLTRNTSLFGFTINDSSFTLKNDGSHYFYFARRALSNFNYGIRSSNKFIQNKDSVLYQVTVIPDAFPSINVDEYRDSTSNSQMYYRGIIKDDYGFSNLTFHYRFTKRGDSVGFNNKAYTVAIPINYAQTQQQFFFYSDFRNYAVAPGDEIEYFFEVRDNDGVNGSKPARSQLMMYKIPTLEEIEKMADKNSDDIKKNMEQSLRESKKLQKEMEKLNLELSQKKNLTWEDKKKIQDLLDRQKNMQEQLKNIEQDNKKNNSLKNEFNEQDPKILEKQKQLEELMKTLMNDELQKLMDELQKLMEKADKQKTQDMLEKMKMSNKDLEKELDRNLEIFKQLEFEQKLQDVIDKLRELSEKQENLSKETEKKNADQDALKKEQDALNKEFEKLSEEMKDLKEKNEQLENPNPYENPTEKQEQIKQDMKESMQQLQNNKNNKASQSQKKSSKQMKEMADAMEQSQANASMEQESEDMAALRDILENLVRTSFDQEALMKQLSKVNLSDPKYTKYIQDQKNIKDNAKMIEDSLLALSKRQPQIKSFVNKEISAINSNMDKTIEQLEARNIQVSTSRQQSIMTSVNNLALMLSETLQQMQQQMQQKSSSCKKGGSCKKPGSSVESISSMRQLQKQLNQQIEKMKQELDKQGMSKTPSSNGKMSEQLARMAAEQEALRNELRKLSESLKNDPNGNSGNLDKIAKEMEEIEKDIVNKMITNETLMRQQRIMDKLLEAEKAERERDMEEKRESNEAKNDFYSNPVQFLKYKNLTIRQTELLKPAPPSLNSFYKHKVNEYFNNFAY